MPKLRLACLLAMVAGCYMSPDTHRTGESARGADGGMSGGLLDAGPTYRGGQAGDSSEADSAAGDGARPDATAYVECTSDAWCSVASPVCRGGQCSGCSAHEQCARFPDAPTCANGSCVPCTSDHKSGCPGDTPACDLKTNRCVECAADTDCPSTKAKCGYDTRCSACTDDLHCAPFNQVCDSESGECVDCRPQTEESDCRVDLACDAETTACPGTACDPRQLVCGTIPRGSVRTCGACVSDSECTEDHRCIPMYFGTEALQQELGGFCMKVASSGCTEPFRAPALSRGSLSGAPAENYCGIDEAVTTCLAIEANRLARKCADDSACGPGARCEPVNFGDRVCTYSCASPLFCLAAYPCGGTPGDEYCGGPPGGGS